MVKVSSHDIVAILRKFELADDLNVPRHIEMVKITNPNPKNTLVGFRFNKKQYYILLDDTADDDVEYITSQIASDKQDVVGEVIKNPTDHNSSYGVPFKGKE